jgi:hypothetical protein
LRDQLERLTQSEPERLVRTCWPIERSFAGDVGDYADDHMI